MVCSAAAAASPSRQQCGNGIALCAQKNGGGEVKIKVRKGQDLFLVKDRDKQPVHKALFLCIEP